MAVATGVDPRAIGESWALLDALERAAADRWGVQEELLATLVERVDELLIAFAHANTDKDRRGSIRKPLQIPRPGERVARKSWLDIAMAVKQGVST